MVYISISYFEYTIICWIIYGKYYYDFKILIIISANNSILLRIKVTTSDIRNHKINGIFKVIKTKEKIKL